MSMCSLIISRLKWMCKWCKRLLILQHFVNAEAEIVVLHIGLKEVNASGWPGLILLRGSLCSVCWASGCIPPPFWSVEGVEEVLGPSAVCPHFEKFEWRSGCFGWVVGRTLIKFGNVVTLAHWHFLICSCLSWGFRGWVTPFLFMKGWWVLFYIYLIFSWGLRLSCCTILLLYNIFSYMRYIISFRNRSLKFPYTLSFVPFFWRAGRFARLGSKSSTLSSVFNSYVVPSICYL